MMYKIGECKECKCTRPIVNKKYGLCDDCNKLRINPNYKEVQQKKLQDRVTKQREKNLERQKDTVYQQKVKKHHVSKLSHKEKESKKKLHETYQHIDSTRQLVCVGCGSTSYPLSHSHIISRSKRKDLEADEFNIGLDCLSIGEHKGCHDIWEHGDWKEKMTLLNYQERMDYIKRVDPALYNRFKQKEDEVLNGQGNFKARKE